MTNRRAPRLLRTMWLRDFRLLSGMAVVCIGAVVAVQMWPRTSPTNQVALIAVRDLPAGMRISAADVRRVPVEIPATARRILLSELPRQPLARAVASGALLSTADVHAALQSATRLVTLNVDAGHAPAQLQRGQQVDVWATASDGLAAARSAYVGRVIVAHVQGDATATGSRILTVQVDARATGRLVSVLHNHDLDVVEVPR